MPPRSKNAVMGDLSQDYQWCLEPEQQVEWDVVESIYPEYVSIHPTKRLVILEIPVQLQTPHQLVSPREIAREARVPSPTSQKIHEVTALPPVALGVQLSSAYPSVEPPHIVSITSLHSWLPHDHGLREWLAALWHEGEGVLCLWIEYIESGRFLEEAGLLEPAKSVIRLRNLSPDLVLRMKEWDTGQRAESFERTSYACTVCLSSVKGSRCILLSCSHVFCRECLEDYWRILIVEGDVVRVGCPDPECLKMRHKAKEGEVRMVVDDGEFKRWKRLTEKAAAESDPTVVYCPLQICQSPVSGPAPDDPAMVGSDLVRVCPKCNFSFCSFCLRSWHGPVSDCHIDNIKELVEEYHTLEWGTPERLLIESRYGRTIEAYQRAKGSRAPRRSAWDLFMDKYLALPEDGPERAALEAKHGEVLLAGVAARLLEEKEQKAAGKRERARLRTTLCSDKQWVKENVRKCPGCKVFYTKESGCDHMTCSQCRIHFCFLCSAELPSADPYSHFRKPGLCKPPICRSIRFDLELCGDQ